MDKNQFNIAVGKRLDVYINSINTDRMEFAKSIDFSYQSVNKIINGEQGVSVKFLVSLISSGSHSKLNYNWLLTGEGETSINPAIIQAKNDKKLEKEIVELKKEIKKSIEVEIEDKKSIVAQLRVVYELEQERKRLRSDIERLERENKRLGSIRDDNS